MRVSVVSEEPGRAKPIVFIGMMGTGKTTIGRTVARQLGLHFVDSDAEINRRTDKRFADILRDDAVAGRDLEVAVIADLLDRSDVFVLSLGGGAVVREETQQLLRERARVVWLNSTIDVLLGRVVSKLDTRPMLDGDPEQRLRELTAAREPIYKSLADYKFDSGHGTREQVARKIAGVLA